MKSLKQIRKLGITEAGWERLSQFLDKVNSNAKRKVRLPELLEYAVGKIQERSYTAQDRIDIAWQDYQLQNTGKPISRDEFLDLMVQGFHQPGRRRTNGKHLDLHD